ncbi:MAG: protein-disulfide reductase DsbD family protein [Pseudanabaenaceae cyanobacterium SKYGB_i_bin29]|nr:protein-disulfide reductase DsbD family protein [Pseudanabaenaceae cyanobacterium SKYG29]MDW8421633.1 protein-disulfide reductase DsbD family protein [Pseudanabaenaceae cyanobacterium SKYGB_i_bin29]
MVRLFCICLLLLSLFGAPVHANPIETELSKVSLVSEVDAIKGGENFWVALRWQMRPGWHIYWQNPGDSGMRPNLTWQLPSGFTASDIIFPTPQRFVIPPLPLANFGYERDVYLPVQLEAPVAIESNTVTLQVQAEWLICEQECIPESGVLSLTLPVADAKIDPEKQALFNQIRQSLPRKTNKTAKFTATDREIFLDLSSIPELSLKPESEVTFFPLQDGVIVNAAAQKLDFSQNRPILRLERGYQTDLPTIEGVIALDKKQGWHIKADLSTAVIADRSPASQLQTTNLGQAIGLAFLGGIILNLMPCVLPVLSLRALSIVSLAQQHPVTARLQGLAFTGGVLTCFGMIGFALVLLRSLGQSVGWGFQLQSPLVVLCLAYLLFGVGLNLSGVFVIGGGWMGVGQSLASKAGLVGEFFTGVLAVLMSTPCSAPFMATAVSAALVLPGWQSMAILLTLGLGFAFPYLLLCFAPFLHKFLPKPGAWLEVLPQILAFPIYGTAAWLLWVFTVQVGTEGLASALVGLILLAFAAWLYGKAQLARSLGRKVATIGALIALTACVSLLPFSSSPGSKTIEWEAYSREKLVTLREQGRPVFVNFSAAWCVSCLVNERTTLSQPAVLKEFQRRNVILLKADWTKRNAEITRALQEYGSSGVPLYLLYGANMDRGEPLILPKNLTPEIVQGALEQAVPLS